MLAKTEQERGVRFDVVLQRMLRKQNDAKRTVQAKREKQLNADKAWLAERRHKMEQMARECEKERAVRLIQARYREYLARTRHLRDTNQAKLVRMKKSYERRSRLPTGGLAAGGQAQPSKEAERASADAPVVP